MHHEFWWLLLFSILLTVLSLVLVVAFELPVKYYLWSEGVLTPRRMQKINAVNEWFIGQWQWLTGFAWYTCLSSLLTDSYFGVYDLKVAWWLLCFAILVICFLFIILACYADRELLSAIERRMAQSSEGEHQALNPDNQKQDNQKQEDEGLSLPMAMKLKTVFYKSLRWVPWIAMYFTARKQWSVFDMALGGMSTCYWFTIIVTAICSVVGYGILCCYENLKEGLQGIESEVEISILENTYAFVNLGLCYACGKTFQAMVLGAFSPLTCWCLAYWAPVLLGTIFFACFFSYLNTQYEYSDVVYEEVHRDEPCCGRTGHVHGQFCVCVACAPDAYPIQEFNGHDHDPPGLARRPGGLTQRHTG